MPAAVNPPGGALDQRSAREIEIDVLIAHECASRSRAAALLWRRTGLRPPRGPVTVEYQQPCGDGRVGDVRVTARSGRQLLIEDKAAKGLFQKGQVANYARQETERVRTILVAPAAFIRSKKREADRFSAAVSLEEIAEALRRVPEGADAELAASYAHRREEFLRCARDPGWTGNPDEGVQAFGDRYRALVAELTGGKLRLTDGTLQNRSVTTIEFEKWLPDDNFKPLYKFRDGWVDVRVMYFTLRELDQALGSFGPRARCPRGWSAAEQKSTKKYPVLRYEVLPITGPLSADAFDETRRILVEVVDELSRLKSWWERHGKKRLVRPPDWERG
jgi:hypothetical protein